MIFSYALLRPFLRRPVQGRREAAEAAQIRQRLVGTQRAAAEAKEAAAAEAAQLQLALVEAEQTLARAEAQIVQLRSRLADAQQVEEARAVVQAKPSLVEAQEVGAPCGSGRGALSVAQQLMAQMLQQRPVAAAAAGGAETHQQQQQRHRDRESLDLTQMETPTHEPMTAVDFAPEVAAAGGSDLGVDLDVDPSRSMRQQSGPLSLHEAPPDSAPPDNDVSCVLETLLPLEEEMGDVAGWRLPAAVSRGRNMPQGLDLDRIPPAVNDQGPVCIDLSEASPYAPAAARASSQLHEGAATVFTAPTTRLSAPTGANPPISARASSQLPEGGPAPVFTAVPTACPPASAGAGKLIPQGSPGVSRGCLPLPLQPSLSLGPLGEDSVEVRVNQQQQQRQRQEQPSLLPGEEKEMRGASGRRLPAAGSRDGLPPRQQQPSPSVSLGPAEEAEEEGEADVEEASCDNFASYVSPNKREKRRTKAPVLGDGAGDMDPHAAAHVSTCSADGGRAVRQEESEGGQRQRPREKRPHPPPPGDEGRKQQRGAGATATAAALGFGTAVEGRGALLQPPAGEARKQQSSHLPRGYEGASVISGDPSAAGAASTAEAEVPLQPLGLNGGGTGAVADRGNGGKTGDRGKAQRQQDAQPKQPPQHQLEAPKPNRPIKPLASGTVVGCWKGFVATPRPAGGTPRAVPHAEAGAGPAGGAVAGAAGGDGRAAGGQAGPLEQGNRPHDASASATAAPNSEAARSGRTLSRAVVASSAAATTAPELAPPPILARPSAVPYKYVEVVRGKAEREALQGVACRQCEQFYAALRSWEGPEGGGGGGGDGPSAAGSRQHQRGREGPSGLGFPICGHVQQQQSRTVVARAEGSVGAGEDFMGRDETGRPA